jgi:glycerol kinase
MISRDKLSARKRKDYLDSIKGKNYELIVIGGGITGAGIALDAVTRGVKTLLIEKNDFASGTSSKSTKLIHGGLRYLKQLELGLVKETGQERGIVHDMAPHLVVPEKMLLPLTKTGSLGKTSTSLALKVYDFLAGVGKDDQRKMLEVKEVKEMEPMLEDNQELVGGAIYAEYRTDDARLVIEIIKKSVLLGADVLNYVEAGSFITENGKVKGVAVKDNLTEDEFEISADVIVNATGPWVDKLRDKDGSLKGKMLHLTKGVHLVVDREKLPLKQALYFDVPDGRMIFTIPRGKITYIGTTDTFYGENIDHVYATKEDVNYLLRWISSLILIRKSHLFSKSPKQTYPVDGSTGVTLPR